MVGVQLTWNWPGVEGCESAGKLWPFTDTAHVSPSFELSKFKYFYSRVLRSNI